MTVEEIFSLVAGHMVEGLMTHAQLADLYNFLGLKGIQKCHEYHYYCENKNFRDITDYYLTHYNKLIKDQPFKNPKIIPENWIQFNRFQVDENTRKTYIQHGLQKWVDWERETKSLYQEYYQDLMQNGSAAAAFILLEYIKDVDNELADAEQKLLFCSSINFDIHDIALSQEDEYQKYKKKIKEIKL